MKLSKVLLLMSVVVVLFQSCKGDDDVIINTPPADKLVITIQEQYETPPSRVSVFFKVDTDKGNPVAGLTQDDFTILEKGRNDDAPLLISADEAERAINDNQQLFRYNTILLLDLSGSVVNNSLEQTKEAANTFIDDIMANNTNSSTNIGVWWFDGADALHQLINFTDDATALHNAIDGINPGLSNDNSTDLFGAIIKASALAETKLIENQLQGILTAVSIICFTDGTDQAARYAKEDAYTAVDNASEGINFYSIGLGSEIDATVLNKIGKNSSVFADDTAALKDKFLEISGLIYDEANSYYLFEYCTPKRDGSGESELHIRVENDNREGEKITTFDATGFFEGVCQLF